MANKTIYSLTTNATPAATTSWLEIHREGAAESEKTSITNLLALAGISNLTTQYRIPFVDSVGVLTESSSIVTTASGQLAIGGAPIASEKLHVAGDTYVAGDLEVGGDIVKSRAYGYISSSAATSSITTGTPRNLAENATIAAQDVAAADFTVDNTAKNVKYTGTTTKNFHVSSNISMTSSVSNQTVSFYIAKNGTVVTGSRKDRKIATGADVGNVSVDWAVSLATDDTVSVYVDLSTPGTVTAEQCTIAITQV